MATVQTMSEAVLEQGDEPLFEIIDGQHVELPPMGAYSSIIASRLHGEMRPIAKAQSLGEAVMETLFRLALPVDRNRRPDIAFVSYERWPKGKPQSWTGNAWDVVPNLAVEVVSPHDLADELMEKIDEYFRSGVQLIWVVYPHRRMIHVYSSFQAIKVLTQTDILEGGDMLPGFRLPLSDLFTEELIDAKLPTDDEIIPTIRVNYPC